MARRVGPGTCREALQKTNRNDVQVPLLLLQGAIVTVLALVFVVAPNTSSAFALLQDMSVILYMGMYVFMFAAVIKLRRSQPDRERPIKIPAVQLVAGVGILASVSAIVLGLTPPSGYGSTSAVDLRRDRRRRSYRAGHSAPVHLPLPASLVEHRSESVEARPDA